MLQRWIAPSIFLILFLAVTLFAPNVAEANNSPNTVGPIPAQTVAMGATLTMNLNTYFNDIDGDALTYTVTSSNTAVATVGVSSTTLTVTPVAAGTATITLTGTDPGGLSATHDFSLTVTSANNAPTTIGTIPEQTLTLGGAAVTIDLSSYFSDADGDILTYTATSGDTTKVTVSVSGADVTLTPVAAGTVTVVVQATDPEGASAKQDITVDVQTPPAAPVVKGTIPNFDLLLGASSITIVASLYFSDANGDELTYTVTSSDTAVATISLSHPLVTVNHVGVGTATITVTATDPGGLSATQTFTVTVTSNSAPTPVGTVPTQTAPVGGSAITVNMDNYFNDADQQPLTYTASSSNTGIATVSVSGANVSITGKTLGTATVTVTANDTFATATQSITVNVKNPPTAVGTIPDIEGAVNQAGKTITLSGYFSDPNGQTLTYSASVSDAYYVSVYVNSSNELEVTPLAAGNATITVTATNTDGLSATQSFSVKLTESVFVGEADAVPGLSGQEQLLLGQLLNYDTIIFNELHNSTDDATDWLELRNVSTLDIPLDNWQLSIQTGSGTAIISFPTGTVIPAGEVLLLTNTERTTAAVVVESFVLPQSEFALILRSPTAFGDLAGNYFQNQKERPDTAPELTVDTVWERVQATVSGYRAEAWAASTHRNGLGSPGYQPPALLGDLNHDGVVNILDLVFVASQFGTTGITAADLNGDNTVNIQDLVLVANALSNVAAAPAAGQSTAAMVNTWLQLARQHTSDAVSTSLREGFSYARGIQVLEQLIEALTPETTALFANYPNPFNPETWIPYQLAKAADVTISIYASDGNVVRTLALGHQDAGMYKHRTQAAYWDGKNELGESVASGLYFYTLTAGNFTATRRMLILK